MGIPINYRRHFAFKKRMLLTKKVSPPLSDLAQYVLFSRDMLRQWRQEYAENKLLSPEGYRKMEVQLYLTGQAEDFQKELDALDPINPDYTALSVFPKALVTKEGKLPVGTDTENLFPLNSAFAFSAWAICHCILQAKTEAMFHVHRIFFELSRMPGFTPFASSIWEENKEYSDTSIMRVNNSNWWNLMLSAFAGAQDIYAMGLVPAHEHQAILDMFRGWARLMAINFCARCFDNDFTRLGNRGVNYEEFIIPEREPEEYTDSRNHLGFKYKPYEEFPGSLHSLHRYMNNRRGLAALAATKMYFFIRNWDEGSASEPMMQAVRNSIRNFYKNTIAFGLINDEANGIDSVFFELYRSVKNNFVRTGFNYSFISLGAMCDIACLFALHEQDSSLMTYETRVQTHTADFGFRQVDQAKSIWRALETLDKMQRGQIVVSKPDSVPSLPMDGGSQDPGGGNVFQWVMAGALPFLQVEDPEKYAFLKQMILTEPAYPFPGLNWNDNPSTVIWGQIFGLFHFPGIPPSFYVSVADTEANPFRRTSA